jgi:hypothetical protein
VRFSPQGAGNRLGKITVKHPASATSFTLGLGGYGYAPVLSFTPAIITTVVGTYPSSKGLLSSATGIAVDGSDTLYVSNTSNNTLTLTSANLTGPNAGDFKIDPLTTSCLLTAGSTLHSGQSCKIGFLFTPAAGGTRTASLILNDNTVTNSNTIQLFGNGTLPSATLTINSPASGASSRGRGGGEMRHLRHRPSGARQRSVPLFPRRAVIWSRSNFAFNPSPRGRKAQPGLPPACTSALEISRIR